jgi:hypothetical protein
VWVDGIRIDEVSRGGHSRRLKWKRRADVLMDRQVGQAWGAK